MYGTPILNTKVSAIISILSGIGFVAVLSITPVVPPKNKGQNFYDKEDTFPAKIPDKKIYAELEKNKLEEKVFSIRTIREMQKDFSSATPFMLFWENLLKKGYTILFSEKNGSLIISSKDLLIGDQLTAKLSDGELKVTIGEIKYK
jgi:hypothetical protein